MSQHPLVVADTSPLNYLIRLGSAEVLQNIFGEVIVPQAVVDELRHEDAPVEVRSWAASLPEWIERRQVDVLDGTLPAQLGAGEREAISLARNSPGALLIVDDFRARSAARERGIEFTGTLAVVREASRRGHLNFVETLRSLKAAGFRISQRLESAIVAQYERQRKSKR